jgi:hypothetical protein
MLDLSMKTESTRRCLKRFFIGSILVVFTFLFPILTWASPLEDVVLALENWTSFHWGKDCLIWIVHYSDEIVDPWTDEEATKAKFNEAKKDEYKKAFISELRMNEAEPFLVSVYAFGSVPLELKPFADNISLVNSDGERFKPVSYERVFDSPISGMVQGLVFFTKQSNKDFTLALKGTGVFDERIFSFQNKNGNVVYDNPPIVVSSPKQEDLIVIDMPPALPPAKRERKKNEDLDTPPLVIEENFEIETAADYVEKEIDKQITPDRNNLYISKEKTLQNFINSWIANDTRAMYDMLSVETRKMYSLESFEKEIRKSADFRRGLLSGYRIGWIGEERVKITTTKKMLVMRTLISKTLGVVRTGKEWLIVW